MCLFYFARKKITQNVFFSRLHYKDRIYSKRVPDSDESPAIHSETLNKNKNSRLLTASVKFAFISS